ncbi:MAG: SRPBCC family protein [Myxococcaceae bacterium]
MLKKILLTVAVAIVGLGAFIASRPAAFHIERAATIAAPPDVVFGLVNDFRQWDAWSPWDKRDPNQTRTYSGPQSGVGAGYAWRGNKDVGEGKMTILAAQPNERIDIKLEFIAPMTATNQTVFTFKPEANGTRVTWSLDGENDFMGKAFSVVMNMDKMVGGDFEQGLTNMSVAAQKELAKRAAAQAASALSAAGAEVQKAAQEIQDATAGAK